MNVYRVSYVVKNEGQRYEDIEAHDEDEARELALELLDEDTPIIGVCKIIPEWMICPTCRGDGSHSRRFGAISMEEFMGPDWDEDEREMYMSGGYDERCNTCDGTGKVRDTPSMWRRHEDQQNLERGVNDAGEPLW